LPLTIDQKRRYGRQIRLADIGEAGQERLCNAKVALRATDPLAREIESTYIKATGMSVINDDEQPAATVDLGMRHEIPRSIAEGAFHALIAFTTAK
jgi:hypothetical protein